MTEQLRPAEMAALASSANVSVTTAAAYLERDMLQEAERPISDALDFISAIRASMPERRILSIGGYGDIFGDHRRNKVGMYDFARDAYGEIACAKQYVAADTHLMALEFLHRASVALGYLARSLG